MAFDWTMKRAKDVVIQAAEEYAASRDFASDQIGLFIRVNDRLGRIHVFLVAPSFPGPNEEEQWIQVRKYFNSRLKEEVGLADSINLTLRTWEQFKQGGIYTPSDTFEEVKLHLAK